ncbi:hypothetical protein V2J09_012825 [Rumex salicifolius]
MGRKLDAMLGRKFRPSRLRPLANLALSRLAVLKSQRQPRLSLARTDVVHFLGLGQHDRALLRVEQVIKEQNMMDVLAMIESYCCVVIERIDLIQDKECPEEMKEAVSSLIFASSRTGEFPELQELRAVFASCFGKEFVARSVELRNNCGVNIKMIQKLSTRQPSLQTRMKALREIADENGIALNLEDATEERLDNQNSQLDQQMSENVEEELNGSVGDTKRKYKDVADAAQAAFQSAANAAEAAKAAVELSRYRPPDNDSNDTRDIQRKEEWKNKEISALSEKTLSYTKEALEDDVISLTAQEEITEVKGSPLPYYSHQKDLPSLSDGVEESELKNPVTHSTKGASATF